MFTLIFVILLSIVFANGYRQNRINLGVISARQFVSHPRLFGIPRRYQKYNADNKPTSRIPQESANENRESLQNPTAVKNFARQTIWGQNIINCRSFNIESQRKFEFMGSFTKDVPIFPLPEIAFLGRSNVGKSSLLNSLTDQNKKIAIESKIPGRTRAINLFKCSDHQGPICNFVDLPGYGFAKMSKDMKDDVNEFVRRYLSDRGALRMAVLLVDIRREPQELDKAMVQVINK